MNLNSKVKEDELSNPGSASPKGNSLSSLKLVRKRFGGKFAVSAEEFTDETVDFQNKTCFLHLLFI